MSVLSQFFPRVGGAEGFIEIQALIAAGGGGGGAAGSYAGGGGGGGGLYFGYIAIKPGSTCPITVGGGGAGGGPSSGTPGGQGSSSSLTTPVRTINVIGGGGGWSGGDNSQTQPSGGSGGGGFYGVTPSKSLGVYSYGGGGWFGALASAPVPKSDSGFYGGPAYFYTPEVSGSPAQPAIGGGAGGNCLVSSPSAPAVINSFRTDIIAGSVNEYCGGGGSTPPSTAPAASNTGNGGSAAQLFTGDGYAGGSGVVIVRYPTQFGAAPSFPGATDLTPTTSPFGFRTYRFTSPGSITLP